MADENKNGTLVQDLMTSEVLSLEADDDFISADQIMRLEHVRHVPVRRDGKLVGLVTHRDLMAAQVKMLTRLAGTSDELERFVSVAAGEIMTKDFLSCSADTRAEEAARLMRDNKAGAVLVTDDEGDLVGIVTASDIMSWAIEMAKQLRG